MSSARTETPTAPDAAVVTWRDFLIGIVLVLASIALVAVHVPQHQTVSPIDEYVYIDYYAKVLEQGPVVRGEETGEYAREYLACHGVRAIGYYPEQLCATEGVGRDSQYPNAGISSVEAYTPIYFFVTRVLAQPLNWMGVEITDAGRAIGGLWLAAGVLVLYAALRRFGVGPWIGLGLGLVFVGSLPAYWSNTYISTDATAILAGGLMLLLGAGLTQRARPAAIVWFGVAAAFVTALKLQNLLAIVVVALWLLATAAVDARRGGAKGVRFRQWLKDRRSLAALVAIASGLITELAWIVTASRLAIGPTADQGISVAPTLRRIVNDAFKTLPGVTQGALSAGDAGPTGFAISVIMTLIVVGGVIGLAVSAPTWSRGELLALSTLVVSFVGLPALAIAIVVALGGYFELPARYGIALIPAMIVCAGLLFSTPKRWLPPVVIIAGAASFGMALLLRG